MDKFTRFAYLRLQRPQLSIGAISYDKIPIEMDNAALIDGCTHFQALRYVIAPIALPGLISTAILTFIFCWNEFLFALTFTLDESSRLASVGIALFQGTYEVPWGILPPLQ